MDVQNGMLNVIDHPCMPIPHHAMPMPCHQIKAKTGGYTLCHGHG